MFGSSFMKVFQRWSRGNGALAVTVWWLAASVASAAPQRATHRQALHWSAKAPGTDEEKQEWERVAQTRPPDKTGLVRNFLKKYPKSKMAPLAHYLLAIEAFQRPDYTTFVREGEAALGAFPEAVKMNPEQLPRWLDLLAQMAFYDSESGRYDPASSHAQTLLSLLLTARKPEPLSTLQWSQYRTQLVSTANYALGRAYLGKHVQNGGSALQDPLLNLSIHHLEKAAETNPLDAYAYFRLGSAYQATESWEKAIQSLARAALSGGPASGPALNRLKSILPSLSGLTSSLPDLLEQQRTYLKERLLLQPRSIFALRDGRPNPVLWWDGVPDTVREESLKPGPVSNIRLSDYAGPETCEPCHSDKYEGWSHHSHRWMNAIASAETVKGDFSGQAEIKYRGGRATFFRFQGRYRMRLVRGRQRRVYQVERTVGSRFFQYFVGRQIEGPEEAGHPIWKVDHLLPFGYWLEEKEWVPTVHIDLELPDKERADPFAGPSNVPYDKNCSPCHTTRPIGDWLLLTDGRLRSGAFSPRPFSFFMSAYLAETHPQLVDPAVPFSLVPTAQVKRLLPERMDPLPAQGNVVTLGVSCEACHNGARQHVAKSTMRATTQPPLFFPSSPDLFIVGKDPDEVWGRNPKNLNWICSRCHSGGRPQFAAGIDTWNSTEYSDARSGHCYDPDRAADASLPLLTCVKCHDPHHTIGKKWSRTADQDDAKCLNCHSQYEPAAARLAHTHHTGGSSGARCMNCHMPRLNEGLQEVVRTHHIFSPTEPRMIEANQPNACNLCHLDKPIDWTVKFLRTWYGAGYSETKLTANYPDRSGPVGLGWLKSPHESTRLVAAFTLAKVKALWSLPDLIEVLDDPYLLNRQLTQKGLQDAFNVRLQEFGYRFYMPRRERRGPLKRVRAALLKKSLELRSAQPAGN
ncbi:MAG: hypothetical protein ACE5JX_18220 [Acidobacteriota bacterium]